MNLRHLGRGGNFYHPNGRVGGFLTNFVVASVFLSFFAPFPSLPPSFVFMDCEAIFSVSIFFLRLN